MTNLPAGSTDAATIVEVATAAAKIRDQIYGVNPDEGPFLVRRPDGIKFEVIDPEKYADFPYRKRGTVTVTTADSLCRYVQRHALDTTTLWAQREAGQVIAVFDDHEATHEGDGEAIAGWGQHRAVLTLRSTPDWDRWIGHDGAMLSQVDFAELVEDGAGAIVDPPAADMLELAQSFQASREVAFKSGSRLQNGETQLIYDEQLDATVGRQGQMRIPNTFTLGLSPFEGLDPYRIGARLRWRLNGPKLTLGYKLERPEEVVRQAFDDVLADILVDTEIRPFDGIPRP